VNGNVKLEQAACGGSQWRTGPTFFKCCLFISAKFAALISDTFMPNISKSLTVGFYADMQEEDCRAWQLQGVERLGAWRLMTLHGVDVARSQCMHCRRILVFLAGACSDNGH